MPTNKMDINVIEYKGQKYMSFDSLLAWLKTLHANSLDGPYKDCIYQMIGMVNNCEKNSI